MAKILVSVPVLGRPHLKMMQSLYSAIHSCKEHDIQIYYSENDSMISRVRNVHLSAFMHEYEECDYFISIDSDLEIINKFSSNNIFTKLVSHEAKFVGGLYALKNDEETICSSVPMDRNRQPNFDQGLLPMLWMSSGCWCLHRSAVEKMIDAYPDLIYDGDDNMSDKKIYGLYIPMLQTLHLKDGEKKKYLSEDWSFCQRWRDIGGQIFADTSIVLRHYGEKSHALWNFEVVVQKKVPKSVPEDNGPQQELMNPEMSEMPEMPNVLDLPEAGFDLGGQL